jgi:prevent-host-death family protein
MTTIVNMHEAKTHLSQLVAQAENGQDIVLARSGKPVVRIVRYATTEPVQRFGAMAGQLSGLSAEEWAESDRDLAQLWQA